METSVNAANIVNTEQPTPQYIKITRNFRFREVPAHSHTFLELNYMYSGTCLNTVDGKEYVMGEGDILIMDTKSSHQLGWTGENDILINILILPQYAESAFMEMLTRAHRKSFVQIRNEFRLNSIDERLKSTSRPVKAVAEEYGFNNATHFYRLYKDYFGRYPRG